MNRFIKKEEQQIVASYSQGFLESENMDKGAEQYYNKTFTNL
jgi:hypothetical protein